MQKNKITGLTDEQVNERIKKNQINYDTTVPTKSIKRILFENFFTLFNFINLFLGIAIFLVGSYKNLIFLGVVIINTAISTIQEIHSKRVIDKLSIMASKKVVVIRNGKKQEISINELVLDDVVELNTGNQVSTDSIILEGDIQVNESFITGEPDTISKKVGDKLLSGTYLTSGKCLCKVINIGEENYTAKISSGAKYVKKVNSEIMRALKKIIKILSFAIVPIGLALFISQLHVDNNTFQDAVVKTVAAVIGMIPEGLVLLTSTVLAVSVIRLSRVKVLVQELYCIETLARVDTLCLDKTGTLTEGIMEVKDLIPINKDKEEIKNILANIAKASEDKNSTIEAIKNKYKRANKKFKPINNISFSSKTKWSGVNFEKEGSFIIGAPEIVLKEKFKENESIIEKYTEDYRVIALVHSNEKIEREKLPNKVEFLGLVLISDRIRKNASQTLKYFYNQGVDIKIISGDNPITVSKIAKQVQVIDSDKYIDMSKIKDENEINEIVDKYTIFGRVSPTQKELIIKSLQNKEKTVAMTGDGVNDVLALKASDCSIAMANGSDATKSVSQLVLLDSNFDSMPKIVAEGRRTINNIQRSASLFLVKTIYSTILALMFLILREEYPFVPIQLSFIGVITIGIPSFILALEPNKEKIRGNFLKNIVQRAIPTGLTVVLNILSISILNKMGIIPDQYTSSLCVLGTGISGIILLFTLTKARKGEDSQLPISVFRLSLAIILTILFILGMTLFNGLFGIEPILPMFNQVIRIIITSIINFIMLTIIFKILLK